MRRRSVGGEQRAASLSRGWQYANTEESFYCTHSSTLLSTLQCSFTLFHSSPLLRVLAHLSFHFSCQFSLFFLFIADLHLRYLLSNSSVVNTKSGAIWVFSKTLKKIEFLCPKRVRNLHGGLWDVCAGMTAHGWASAHVYVYDYMCITAQERHGGVQSHVWLVRVYACHLKLSVSKLEPDYNNM